MNLVQVLPKGRFGEMISFEFHLKNRHEKTQKPLWFLGFQPRYLFRCYLLARCTEKDIVGKSFAIKALKPSGNFFTAFMWQKLKNRKSTTPTIVCPRIMLIEKLDPVQNVSFVVLSIKLGFLIPQPFPHRYPL